MSSSSQTHDAEPIPPGARDAIDELLRTGDLFRYRDSRDAPVALLEREFAELIGSRHALALSSCSAALFLSLRALDLPPGARILIPGFTFSAVPSAVVNAGCVPVLCETGEDYRIDLADFEARLVGVQAVIVSHMRGHTSDMDAIMALCDARALPVIEDAAHSLGTRWGQRNIGTIGRIGCFSFQSYKMVNAGEGGMLVTDDPDLLARAVIMSGAYERNWEQHRSPRDDNSQDLERAFLRWQNRLPLSNVRMSNLSAAVIRPQLAEVPHRVRRGLANHDRLAARLRTNRHFSVPAALGPEQRAPDSIQFNLVGLDDATASGFVAAARSRGVDVGIFGAGADNARVFWNWKFLPEMPELPRTRAMLMRACDLRLPVRRSPDEIDAIGGALLAAMDEATRESGTVQG